MPSAMFVGPKGTASPSTSPATPSQMDGFVTGRTIESTEILIIQKRSFRPVISRGSLRIDNRESIGIKALHWIAAILVTPEAILIFTIIVVILSRIHYKSDLARANWAPCLECRGL